MNRRNLLVLIIICVSLLISMASGLVISPVCTEPGWQQDPEISGDTIVWQSDRDTGDLDWDIYMWDPRSGEKRLTFDEDYIQDNPHISGDTIVWRDEKTSCISMWDPANPEQQICPESLTNHLAISGDTIVWEDSRDYATTGDDIYKWDPVNKEQPVCTESGSQNYPAISGDTIVWEDSRDYATNFQDIYMWDPVNKEQPVCTKPGRQYQPAISGDTIVWFDDRDYANNKSDIYKWDPVNGEQPVCTKPSLQTNPAISGDIIVWGDDRNLATTGWDIYMWDPVNGEQPVCTDHGNQLKPAISGDIIVWEDDRNWDGVGEPMEWDIYMADLSKTPPIANAGPDQTVIVNEPVTFDGSGSLDSDGTIVSYAWDFSVPPSGGMKPSHTYTAAGTYTVTLTVTDDDGLTDSDNVKITVNTLTKSIQDLRVKVVSLKLPALIEKGLTDKLDASNLQINKMQYSAAKQSLTAFTYQVKAQTGKANNLNQATAYELITTAQRIINSIPKK
jgi:beta propeller repeat protein